MNNKITVEYLQEVEEGKKCCQFYGDNVVKLTSESELFKPVIIAAIGDVVGSVYNREYEEVCTFRDKNNSGTFGDQVSDYIKNDNDLAKYMEHGLVINNSNALDRIDVLDRVFAENEYREYVVNFDFCNWWEVFKLDGDELIELEYVCDSYHLDEAIEEVKEVFFKEEECMSDLQVNIDSKEMFKNIKMEDMATEENHSIGSMFAKYTPYGLSPMYSDFLNTQFTEEDIIVMKNNLKDSIGEDSNTYLAEFSALKRKFNIACFLCENVLNEKEKGNNPYSDEVYRLNNHIFELSQDIVRFHNTIKAASNYFNERWKGWEEKIKRQRKAVDEAKGDEKYLLEAEKLFKDEVLKKVTYFSVIKAEVEQMLREIESDESIFERFESCIENIVR